ncbi:MAG: hypothetical protein KDD82_16810 [Planctomycetes bacterium]|nr:hypothetical protein [Planctomycetota bacterium]
MYRLLLATDGCSGDPAPIVQGAQSLTVGDEPNEVILLHAVSPEEAVHGLERAEASCALLEAQLLAGGVQVSSTRVLRVSTLEALLAVSCRELSPRGVVLAAAEESAAVVRSATCPALVVGPRWRIGQPVRSEDLRAAPPLVRWQRARECLSVLAPEEACAVFAFPEGAGPRDVPWSALERWAPARAH